MKKINYKLSLVLLISIGLFSCNDILDETPDNRTEIDSLEKINELLVAAYPEATYASFLEPMTDNAGDKNGGRDNVINEEMFFWNDLQETIVDTPVNYWNQTYEAIAQANQALASLDELGFSNVQERGEALICRAYAHFMLVSIFSKAYDPATADTDLGIPYVTEPETTLIPEYKRATVATVYENIEKDLVEGLKFIGDNYDVARFHFTTNAAHGFASRFYLNKGEWQNVITHSNLALGEGSGVDVLRKWETDYRPRTYSEQTAQFPSSTEPANLLVVVGNSLFDRFHASARYQLNQNIRDELFGANATGKNWSYVVFGGDLFGNIPKYDEFFRVTNQAAGIGIALLQIALITTDEVILNRAEAYAMLGRFEESVTDINNSLSVKTRGYDASTDVLSVSDVATNFEVTDPMLYTPFYEIPAEALPFVNLVLTMKKTVFYNEGLRWFDIKRHNIEITHRFGRNNSNSVVLPKKDPRRLLQIPEDAQAFGIEANPR